MIGCPPNPLMMWWLNSPFSESSQTLSMSHWVCQQRLSWPAKVTTRWLWVLVALAFLSRKACIDPQSGISSQCNAANPRTRPCMISAADKVVGSKSRRIYCHFNCWQIGFWHIWWLRSHTASAPSVRRQMDLFPRDCLVVISFHGHINPPENKVFSQDTRSALSAAWTSNVKH